MDKPNFADFRDELTDTAIDVTDIPLLKCVEKLFSDCLYLPEQDTQLPILIAYSLMPSAMATIAPILFLNGSKGSGKTTAMKIIAAIHNQQILSATTSAPAIRNHVNESRWDFPDELEGEKNTILLLDNVSGSTFLNEALYLYFLNGYDRQSDKVMISSGTAGVNLSFRVFGTKVISSIQPLLNFPQFEELARRCLTINFKGLDSLSGSQTAPNITALEEYDLTPLKGKFDEFWGKTYNLKDYVSIKKKLLKLRKKDGIPNGFTAHQWTISVDILATGCVIDLWDINIGLDTLARYFTYLKGAGKPAQPPLYLLLKQFTEREEAIALQLERDVVEINALEVKTLVHDAAKLGQLDCEVRSTLIGDTMRQLGYALEMNNRKTLTWRKNNG
jgi:hypothetical protein